MTLPEHMQATPLNELIADLHRVAEAMGVPVEKVNRSEYRGHAVAKFSDKPFGKHGGFAFVRGLASGRITAPVQADEEPFEIDAPPDEIDINDLLERRKKQFERKRAHEESRKLIQVKVHLDGPIAILHFGDPHVDDDGTDLAALERHTKLVRDTEGLFAANVGDTTNNWVGRLARLYGEQGTSAAEAWALAEWFVGQCQWLYMIGGNHDCWSGAGDPLKWMAGQVGSLYQSSEARLELAFPNGRKVRVNARHDFKGHSQWNPAHGSMKASQMGTRDHILVNGHKHASGYGVIKDATDGTISHCIQVASYKVYDRYAREKGFRDQHISPCAVTLIDPFASEAELVKLYWEPEEAADILTYKRSKRRAA